MLRKLSLNVLCASEINGLINQLDMISLKNAFNGIVKNCIKEEGTSRPEIL
jgi:hypothetical protein